MINAYGLKCGDLVSWVHPATEKKYVFEVKSVDSWDEDQPVRLKLVSKLSGTDTIAVTEEVSFASEDDECWPYLNEYYLINSGYAPSGVDFSNILTLDKLQYAHESDEPVESDKSDSNGGTGGKDGFTTNDAKNKVRSIEDIKPGDRLHDKINNAVFKVIKVEKHRALLEIISQSAQIRACPLNEIEEWFTAPGDAYWVYLSKDRAHDYFEVETGINAWALYLENMLVVEPPVDLPKIETANLAGRKLELTLSNGDKISAIIPKLVLPKPEALRKVRERGNDELLESTIAKIVEYNAEGKTSLKMEYAELLTLKSKLEESGYLVDLADCEISW